MKQSKNVINERRHRIISLLDQYGTVRVSDLGSMLGVSEITVRRDLEKLSSEGLVHRQFGTASLNMESDSVPQLFEDKNHVRLFQKQAIARYIADMVKDGDTVFLNGGTTTMEVLRLIKGKNIVIVTNNALACTVMQNCRASLISTGGEYNPHNQSYTGAMASALIQRINATLCVLGINGITADSGITSSNYLETLINEEMIKRCQGKCIVAADSSKIGKIYKFCTSPISSIDLLVTDSGIMPEQLERFKQTGMEVVLADKFSI